MQIFHETQSSVSVHGICQEGFGWEGRAAHDTPVFFGVLSSMQRFDDHVRHRGIHDRNQLIFGHLWPVTDRAVNDLLQEVENALFSMKRRPAGFDVYGQPFLTNLHALVIPSKQNSSSRQLSVESLVVKEYGSTCQVSPASTCSRRS